MLILNQDELSAVTGGANLYITNQIPTDNISNTCLNGLVSIVKNKTNDAFSDEDFLNISLVCTDNELDILEESDSNAPILTVSYY